jgi:hypothetical protein
MSDTNLYDQEDEDARAELTEAQVFQCIQALENQAGEELALGISYGQFELGELGEEFDGEKEDCLHVVEQALGIRHHAVEDSAEDAAFAQRTAKSVYPPTATYAPTPKQRIATAMNAVFQCTVRPTRAAAHLNTNYVL